MKKNFTSMYRRFCVVSSILAGSLAPLPAGQSGNFTYELINGGTEVEITAYPKDVAGPAVIPATIDSKPVTSIKNSVFSYHRVLTSVSIPAGVTVIGYAQFFGTHALTAITVAAANPQFSSSDGILFNKTQTELVNYPPGKAGSYTVPSSVTSIANGAFIDCAELTAVTIPSSITVINNSTFSECSDLASVTLPSGITSIGDSAFSACGALASIALPASLTHIGKRAFAECHALTSITIPASVATFGDGVFFDCRELLAILVEAGNTHFTSSGGVLFNHAQTELLQYPAGKAGAYVIPASVATLAPDCFRGCHRLTHISIPNGIQSISAGAFMNCWSLTFLDLPVGITNIGDWAFFGCRKIVALTIPAGVTKIGQSAFENCDDLVGICIPASVTSIGGAGFASCDSLKNAFFEGNAPTTGGNIFPHAADAFTVYFWSGATGFTTPTWHTHPAQAIDQAAHPTAAWLVSYGFAYDAPLDQDANKDGVPLLLAYALNLNPLDNPVAGLPRGTTDSATNTLRFTYYAGNTKVDYFAETCTDMKNWTTQGVSLGAPGTDGRRTASVVRNTPARFLRLRVEEK